MVRLAEGKKEPLVDETFLENAQTRRLARVREREEPKGEEEKRKDEEFKRNSGTRMASFLFRSQ